VGINFSSPPYPPLFARNLRNWINYYLDTEIPVSLEKASVAGSSIYFGGKHLMAYASLCLVAAEFER